MSKPFIIAEMSANHLGSLDRAMCIIEAAARSGASAVKLQTYDPEEMVCNKNTLIESGPWAGQYLYALYAGAYTPWKWHEQLLNYIRYLGMVPMSSPFSLKAVEYLETLDCAIYKIASFEMVDLPLIRNAAKTGKPMILSAGMAGRREISQAVEEATSHGCTDLTILKCTSAYPATAAGANLATIKDLKSQFPVKVGISDHTLGIGVAVAAVAIGATVIEKHLTLKRSDGGPDAAFSMEPSEFAQMVTECNRAYEAIGHVHYGPLESERPQLALRRSLYFAQDVEAGTPVTANLLRTARPALGLEPSYMDKLGGYRLKTSVSRETPVTWDILQGGN